MRTLTAVWVPPITGPKALLGYVALALGLAFAETQMLTFSATQRFGFANESFLTVPFAAFALAFGALLAWVFMAQGYAMRGMLHARGTGLSFFGILVAIIPNLLCCSPIIPTLLSLGGLSSMDLYRTSGALQAGLALHEWWFLGASLLLVAVSAVWSTRIVRRAACALSVPASPTTGSMTTATEPDFTRRRPPSEGCCDDSTP